MKTDVIACESMPLLQFVKRIAPPGKIFHEMEGAAYIDLRELEMYHQDHRENLAFSCLWYLADCLIPDEAWYSVEFFLSDEQLSLLNEITVTVNQEVRDHYSLARRPYYRLVGKPITEEQARRLEDEMTFFRNGQLREGSVDFFNFTYPFWRPDGTVFLCGITQTYPHICEYLVDALSFAIRYPFLDMIAAVTGWDEIPPDCWENNDFREDVEQGLYYENFEENIELGLYVHDRHIEILNSENARTVYTQYRQKYGHMQNAHTPLRRRRKG